MEQTLSYIGGKRELTPLNWNHGNVQARFCKQLGVIVLSQNPRVLAEYSATENPYRKCQLQVPMVVACMCGKRQRTGKPPY